MHFSRHCQGQSTLPTFESSTSRSSSFHVLCFNKVTSPLVGVLLVCSYTVVHIHDHSPTGLFRASAAQRDRPNACEGAPGSRKRS